MAIHSFQENLDWIERQGRKDSPDWHLANGLLRLAQGLRQDYEAAGRVPEVIREDLPALGRTASVFAGIEDMRPQIA